MFYDSTISRAFTGKAFPMLLLASILITLNLRMARAQDVISAPAAITIPVGAYPRGIVTGDFNQDGKPDFAAVNTGSNNFVVVLNLGGGSFSAPTYHSAGAGGTLIGDIKTGDFNGDGKLDLATATSPLFIPDSSAQVRLGDGMGGFAAPLNTPIGRGAGAIAVADFNGDGKSDLASANTSGGGGIGSCHGGYAQIFLNNGTGTLNTPVNIDLRPNAYDIVTGDFNGDGKIDLATKSGGDPFCSSPLGGVEILLNNGAGGFAISNVIPPANSPIGLVVGDFNRDGKLDLAGPMNTNMIVLFGTGAGDFIMGPAFPLGPTTYQPQAADFNNDGNLDVAVVDRDGNKALVVYGNGTGGFSSANSAFTGTQPLDLAVADFDTNGFQDLAVTNYMSNSVSIILNVNRPSLPPRTPFDFDGDLRADIAVYRDGNTANAPSYWHILNSSNNTYQGIQHGANGDRPVPADYNGDGKTEVAVWRPSTGVWYTSTNASINYGAFHWGQAGDFPMPGDFDGDGKADHCVYRPSNGRWYLLKSSNGGYQDQQFGVSTDKPVLGDFDGDGKADFAFYRPGAGPLDSSFWHVIQSLNGQLISIQFGRGEDRPVPADYDGDGRANIAVYRPSNFTWYTSTDAATNYGAVQWGTEGDIPAPADYDMDSRADVAVFRPGSSIWYILQSSNGGVRAQYWGTPSDRPVPSCFLP